MGQAMTEMGGTTTREEGRGGDLPGFVRPPRVPWVYLAWADSQVAADQDTIDLVVPDKLQSIGEVLALALTRVLRQTTY
jgi:hypothetical protein